MGSVPVVLDNHVGTWPVPVLGLRPHPVGPKRLVQSGLAAKMRGLCEVKDQCIDGQCPWETTTAPDGTRDIQLHVHCQSAPKLPYYHISM